MMGSLAFVAQRIEHLTTDQKVGGSSPSKRTIGPSFSMDFLLSKPSYPTEVKSNDYLVCREDSNGFTQCDNSRG